MNTITLTLTQQQLKNLVSLIDSGLRATGIQSTVMASDLLVTIDAQVNVQQQETMPKTEMKQLPE